MIRIFGGTDTDFTSNGDVVVRALKAKVHKEDNGDYYLDIEAGLEYSDYFVQGNIIVVDLPQGAQAFRINNVQKTKHRISSKCWHVFYDSEDYITDASDMGATCQADLEYALSGVMYGSSTLHFTVSSDITTTKLTKYKRQTLSERFFEIADNFGGHLVRDNFNVSVNASAGGQDNGVTIQYGKNIKDISCEEDWNDVVSALMPIGKNGFLLSDKTPDPLPYSAWLTTLVPYSMTYSKAVNFSQDSINESDYPSTEDYKNALYRDLWQQGTDYLASNKLPKVCYTLSANVEKLTDIGDTIQVKDERLGVDLTTTVIGFEYDLILEKYTEVIFGNFLPNLTTFTLGIREQLKKTTLNQNNGIIGGRQLVFAADGTLTWTPAT